VWKRSGYWGSRNKRKDVLFRLGLRLGPDAGGLKWQAQAAKSRRARIDDKDDTFPVGTGNDEIY